MASALFTKKTSSENDARGGSVSPLAVVSTMKDDLDEVRSGRPPQTLPVLEEKQPEKSNPVKETAVQKTVSQPVPQSVPQSVPQPVAPSKPANPFREEGEQVPRVEPAVTQKPVQNPFGVATQPKYAPAPSNIPQQSSVPQQKSTPSFPNISQAPSLKNEPSKAAFTGGGMPVQAKKNHNVLWVSIIGVLTLAILGGGLYYYFYQRGQGETVAPLPVTDTTPAIGGETPKVELPYALDKPNYLSFNTENVSPDDIKSIFSQTASRIKAAGITQPVEFLITDQNNNPLAFSRFAFLLKLGVDAETLALMDEPFSLFVYNDVSQARLGLALTFKDSQAAVAVAKTEATLPLAFQALILEPGVNAAKVAVFQSAPYKQYTIRYTNTDGAKNVSFDYAIFGTRWIIGTSKNTLRAILDMQM